MNKYRNKPCPFCVGDTNKKNGRSEDILILNSVEAGGVAVYNAEGHWDVYITDANNQSTEGVKYE